ncbi:MAG: hypothetical protein Q9164_001210, partial [Protoblastenia rupestris]
MLLTPSLRFAPATLTCHLSNQSQSVVGSSVRTANDMNYSPLIHVHTMPPMRTQNGFRAQKGVQAWKSEEEASPKQVDYNEIGYSTLRQCHNEARVLLRAPFSPEMLHPPTGADDAAKRQLQRVILDASGRRLLVQKIFLRATAAVEWINGRNAVLKGGKPKNGDVSKLQQLDHTFRQ